MSPALFSLQLLCQELLAATSPPSPAPQTCSLGLSLCQWEFPNFATTR